MTQFTWYPVNCFLSCNAPRHQTYNEKNLLTSMETLQGEGLQDWASVHWLGYTSQAAWRSPDCTKSTKSLWNPPFPREGASQVPHTLKDCMRQWRRRSCLLNWSVTAPFPISVSQHPFTALIYCRLALGHSLHSAAWPALRAHEPQLGQLLSLPRLAFQHKSNVYPPKYKPITLSDIPKKLSCCVFSLHKLTGWQQSCWIMR